MANFKFESESINNITYTLLLIKIRIIVLRSIKLFMSSTTQCLRYKQQQQIQLIPA